MIEATDILSSINAKIEEARKYYVSNKPPNEACTCDWIIRPLLIAAGYAEHDIMSQASTPGGGYPDYTILPDTPHTWYLEAKDWSKNLDSGAEAIQALNYANAKGQRWVVLSNGREWLLFDNHIHGVEADKRMVARENLDGQGLAELLMALSKPSVVEGRLINYVGRSRLNIILSEQLANKDSEVIKAISSTLRNKLGISSVSPREVAEFFSSQRKINSTFEEKAIALHTQNFQDGRKVFNILELIELGRALWGNTPVKVTFPDNSVRQLKKWSDLSVETIQWLHSKSLLPKMPFCLEGNPKRCYLNTRPERPDGSHLYVPRAVKINNQTVYINNNLDTAVSIKAICDAMSISPTQIVIEVAKPVSENK